MRERSSRRAVRKRSESTSGFPFGVGEQPLRLRLLEAIQRDDLVPRAVSGNEADAAARHVEGLGEQPQHRLVRATVLRRLGYANLPRVAVTARDSGVSGTRRHPQLEPCRRRAHVPSLDPYAALASASSTPSWSSSVDSAAPS